MSTEMLECTETFTNFTDSCIIGISGRGADIGPVLSNIQSGFCSSSLFKVLTSCIPASFFHLYIEGNSPCFSSMDGFYSCLPGAAAYLSSSPKICTLMSQAVFYSNERLTFLEGEEKAKGLVVAQLARKFEVKNCLSSCDGHSFEYMGPNEYPKEIARNTVGAVHKVVAPLAVAASLAIPGGTITGALISGLLGALGSKYHNYLLQIIHALPQQYLRNLDFIETHKSCTFVNRFFDLGSFVHSAAKKEQTSSSNLSKEEELSEPFSTALVETSRKSLVLGFDILHYGVGRLLHISVNLIKTPFSTTYIIADYLIRYFFNSIFYPDQAGNISFDLKYNCMETGLCLKDVPKNTSTGFLSTSIGWQVRAPEHRLNFDPKDRKSVANAAEEKEKKTKSEGKGGNVEPLASESSESSFFGALGG